jgi:hypothetical protein
MCPAEPLVRLFGETGVHLDEIFVNSRWVVHNLLLASMLMIIAISLPDENHSETTADGP